MLDEYRGIPRQAQLLLLLSFVPSIAIGFLIADVSYYLANIRNIPSFWEGVIISTIGLSVVATSVPLGILADKVGRRRMLMVGNISSGLALIGFALTNNIGLLVFFAAAEGTGEAAFAVSFSALIADRAGDAKRTAAFSLGFSLSWIGMAIGAFLIYAAVAVPNVVLFASVGLANLAVTPIILWVSDTARGVRSWRGVLPEKSRNVLFKFGVYAACLGTGSGFFATLMSQWFQGRYGVNDTISGVIIGIGSLVTAAANLLAPRLAKRTGTAMAVVAAQAPATVLMLAVPSSPTFVIAGALYITRVFLMNLPNPLGQSLLMGLVSPDERGAAAGVTATLNRLPNAVTATPGAILIGAGFFGLPFYLAAVFYAVGISWFWLSFRKTKLPEEKAS